LAHDPPMSAGRRYERDPDIVYRRIVDEVVLLPIRHNFGDLESIFTLNEVGARVWDLLDGRRTLVEITDIIVSEFDVTSDVASDDLEEFVRDLEGVGAVHMVMA
jgi:coenzyme PQQ synthesis protein D (PqqD)